MASRPEPVELLVDDRKPSDRSQRILRLLTSWRVVAIHFAVFALGAIAFIVFGSAQSNTLPARSPAEQGNPAAPGEIVVGSEESCERVTKVLVHVGSTVKRGQLLAHCDETQLLAQLRQHDTKTQRTENELVRAIANVHLAERSRYAGADTLEVLQARQAAAASARAKVALARAQRHELELKLAQTRIVAPADGVVSKKTVALGASVPPGTELFRLIRQAPTTA